MAKSVSVSIRCASRHPSESVSWLRFSMISSSALKILLALGLLDLLLLVGREHPVADLRSLLWSNDAAHGGAGRCWVAEHIADHFSATIGDGLVDEQPDLAKELF